MTSMNLDDRAMLVALHISGWGARKRDPQVTEEVREQHGAAPGAGLYTKALVPKGALAHIAGWDGALRAHHERNTLPWGEAGVRILPTANYFAYMEQFGTLKAKRETAVRQFLDLYHEHILAAEQRLGSLFNVEDYPPRHELERSYSVRLELSPVPSKDDFRITLAAEELEHIKADLEGRLLVAQAEATRELWTRLGECVGRMADKLRVPHGEKGGTFHDSLVGNLREVLDVLPRLNVTGDAALTAMAQEAKAKLAGVEPKALRADANQRAQAAAAAEAILAKMAGYTGPVNQEDAA